MITRDLTLTNRAFQHLLLWGLDKGRLSGIQVQCRGYSMAPFIRDGETVILKSLDPGRTIQPGNIVAAVSRARGSVMIHRVIRCTQKRVQTRGDNLPVPDGWFFRDDLVGVVSSVNKKQFKTLLNSSLFNRMVAVLSRNGMLQTVLLPTLRSARRLKKFIRRYPL